MNIDNHYKEQAIDTIKRAEANFTLEEQKACAIFNIDKYTWREKGQNLKDYEKVKAYLEWLIEIEHKMVDRKPEPELELDKRSLQMGGVSFLNRVKNDLATGYNNANIVRNTNTK